MFFFLNKSNSFDKSFNFEEISNLKIPIYQMMQKGIAWFPQMYGGLGRVKHNWHGVDLYLSGLVLLFIQATFSEE